MKKSKNRSNVFVLMSDGECTEGSVWEAAIFASKNKLNNIIALIDNNQISATDFLKTLRTLETLKTNLLLLGGIVLVLMATRLKKFIVQLKKLKT